MALHTYHSIKGRIRGLHRQHSLPLPTKDVLCNLCRKIKPGLGATMHLDAKGRSIIVCDKCRPGHAKLHETWKQAIRERKLQGKSLTVPLPLSDWTPVNGQR